MTYLEAARGWGRVLERREAERSGRPLKDARATVARRAGVSQGTLENLYNGRLKAIAVHVYERLWQAVERELHAELRRLERDLEQHSTRRLGARPIETAQIVADLERVRAALRSSRTAP
jgi:hypothetical protein